MLSWPFVSFRVSLRKSVFISLGVQEAVQTAKDKGMIVSQKVLGQEQDQTKEKVSLDESPLLFTRKRITSPWTLLFSEKSGLSICSLVMPEAASVNLKKTEITIYSCCTAKL